MPRTAQGGRLRRRNNNGTMEDKYMENDETVGRGIRDALNPPYYREGLHARPLECIDVARLLPFDLGCAVKYVWRMGMKGPWREDLGKARWYLRDYIRHRSQEEAFPCRVAALARLDQVDDAMIEQPWHLRLAVMRAMVRGRCDLAREALERLGAWFADRDAKEDAADGAERG